MDNSICMGETTLFFMDWIIPVMETACTATDEMAPVTNKTYSPAKRPLPMECRKMGNGDMGENRA